MNKKILLGGGMALFAAAFCMSAPVYAEEAPATKCVTAATKATNASKVALMEKDIAPYVSEPRAAEAIKKYKESTAINWAAMEEPYCGFGKYGIASSIHSYAKGADRARLAFLSAVKAIPKGKSIAVTKTPTVQATSAVLTEEKAQIPSGLRRGQRSETVRALQKLLAKHFNQSAESEWITGYFGPVTYSYVVKFQLEKKLIPSDDSSAAGLVGPRTSAALNSL